MLDLLPGSPTLHPPELLYSSATSRETPDLMTLDVTRPCYLTFFDKKHYKYGVFFRTKIIYPWVFDKNPTPTRGACSPCVSLKFP